MANRSRLPPARARRKAVQGRALGEGKVGVEEAEVQDAVPSVPLAASLPAAGSSGPGILEEVATTLRQEGAARVEKGPFEGRPLSEAVQDEAFCQQAGRWRSQSPRQKFVTLVARMASLFRIWPQRSPETDHGPRVADPLPLRSQRVEGTSVGQTQPWRAFWWQLWSRWRGRSWAWYALPFLALCFPRLSALLIVTVLRVLIRAIFILVARMCIEVWTETADVVSLAQQATAAVESHLVALFEEQVLGRPSWQWTAQSLWSPPAPEPSRPVNQPTHAHADFLGLQPPPSPPWAVPTLLLLALPWFRRARGEAGGGG